MSITIRLARTGKRNAPTYKVVVAMTKNKQSGRFLDILGSFNPLLKTSAFVLDKKKYASWQTKGALTSKAVGDLVANTYAYKKYEPKAEKGKEMNRDEGIS
ncbi:MAG: SSU ribosomal protein S16P [candidate division WWE3 bacterium GW2011_GWA1_46_21]|uniref:Small ribosomal subunit protein bS16 n=4 Tax=Katanobacteria TaxID=422282 RepID=A0A0G1PCA1_UNCKA|nr:MAG: SSU ribosomal protein S16P [candidate division WWE3 bacterium GW2011_GWA1_46_21]KKU49078.1 MAG: SSU ribosomal protein S16P [candidate division WWE3 bacterium GW2011_GWA2_46_9]KKU51117.1 MAG: SSU ribosomal protein S16P [candidate division WWE3 bacterium GW2011_GWC1_47_10]KKU57502.1 MAG: SSU ribosomal protein S16P [candidate division WWE3 bacterium GW2011_GWB1_47_11]